MAATVSYSGARVVRGGGAFESGGPGTVMPYGTGLGAGFRSQGPTNVAYSTGYGAGFGATGGTARAGDGRVVVGPTGGMATAARSGVVVGPRNVRPGMGPGGRTVVVGPGPGATAGCCAAGCAGGPESEANCGGIGAVCCEASGSMVTGTRWSYVGNGGDYAPATCYNYVGQGCGSYTREVIVTPYGCKLRACCIVVSLLLLLLPLLYFVMTRDNPVEVAPAVPQQPVVPLPTQAPVLPPRPFGPIGKCLIWGDPHGLSFDCRRNDFYSPGEYWGIKSEDIWVQFRYLPTPATNGLAVCKEVAVGGPVINHQKLIVGPREVTLNDRQILTEFNSRFEDGPISMVYNGEGTVLQEGREGKALHIVHINIKDGSPDGILIQVNRWNEPTEGSYINVKIVMHARPGGQDGHCGNFNGNPEDDDRLQIRKRLGKTGVPPNELLFRTKTPVVTADRPNINDCPQQKLDQCKGLCKKGQNRFKIPSMDCLVDCCFGGAGFVQEG